MLIAFGRGPSRQLALGHGVRQPFRAPPRPFSARPRRGFATSSSHNNPPRSSADGAGAGAAAARAARKAEMERRLVEGSFGGGKPTPPAGEGVAEGLPWWQRVHRGSAAEHRFQIAVGFVCLVAFVGVPLATVLARDVLSPLRGGGGGGPADEAEARREEIHASLYAKQIASLNKIRREQGLEEVPATLPSASH